MTVQYLLGKLPFAMGGLISVVALSACSSPSAPRLTDSPSPRISAHTSGPLPAVTTTLPAHSPPSSTPNAIASPVPPIPPAPVLGNDARQALIQTLSAEGIRADWVSQQLQQARYVETVRRLMLPPSSPSVRNWPRYRSRFLDAQRINEGVAFATRHQQALRRATQDSGVPAEIIVAIIGVETFYGRVTGNFRVIDALSTLAFHYPPGARSDRSAFFQEQLADYLRWTHETQQDPQAIKGSFAGAVGLPQFMPGSILKWAKDGDQDGKIDLLNSTDDAIASVGSFLKAHGWKAGQPIFVPLDLPAHAATLVDGGLTPTLSWAQLIEAGARPGQTPAPQGLLGVIDLYDGANNTTEYRSAADNFFVITQYNRSYFYAAAVADLAEAIRRAQR